MWFLRYICVQIDRDAHDNTADGQLGAGWNDTVMCRRTDLLVLQPFLTRPTAGLLLQHDDRHSGAGHDADDGDDEDEDVSDESAALVKLLLEVRVLLLQHLFVDLPLKRSHCVTVHLRRPILVHVQRAAVQTSSHGAHARLRRNILNTTFTSVRKVRCDVTFFGDM